MSKERFDHAKVETEARALWEECSLYETDLADDTKDPYYLLFEFPYPSGDLHIGHWYAFALTDIFARFQRLAGKNVLFPIGFDSFGLPAENAAIKYGKDPAAWTEANMESMRAQIRSMGTSVDWSKEVVTSSPEYYRWTQWLFSKLYEHDLAYRKEAPVKWCPKDMTVLANEQVHDGRCERCGTEVEERSLTQWFMRITQYADRLLKDLDPLPWREDIKEAQRAWIGKSEGARLPFALIREDGTALEAPVQVFTTRPDTVFGATYLVLAPEHPLIAELTGEGTLKNVEEVERYIDTTAKKTERERLERKEKTGVRLEGIMAQNPATKEAIPVYAADYVLASYGTGAVMAVPAHDERDFEFASVFGLPRTYVVMPRFVDESNPPVEGKETVTRSLVLAIVRNPKNDTYLCLSWKHEPWTTFVTGGVEEGEDLVEAARREIKEETGYKHVRLVRKLSGPVQTEFFASHKDVNRIAYGTSILFELEDEEQAPIEDEERAKHEPVWLTLAQMQERGMQHAEMPLIRIWLTKDAEEAYEGDGVLVHSGPFSGRDNREAMDEIVAYVGGERVTNYRLRDWLVSRQRYWGCPIPVVYDPEGNPHLVPAEHLPWLLPTDVDFSPSGKSPLATSRELKERVMRIFGEGWTPEYDTLDTFVDSSWYFLRYLDPKDEHDFSDQGLMRKWLPVNRYSGGSEHTTMHLLYARFFHKALYDLALAPTPEPFFERFNRGLILGPDGAKMSKSKGNVINPDEVVKELGADAVRMYLAFIGPYNEQGSYPWNLDGAGAMRKFLDRIYALREKVGGGDLSPAEHKALAKAAKKVAEDTERFKLNTAISALMILVREFEGMEAVSPEAYQSLLVVLSPYAPHLAEHLWTGEDSVHRAVWPAYESGEEEFVTLGVQVNGKTRGSVSIAPSASEEEAVQAAREADGVAKYLADREIGQVIYKPGRILSLIVPEN